MSAPTAPLADTPLHTLKAAIVAEAQRLGFDLVRVTSADPFPETAAVLHERIAAGLFSGLPWFGHDRAEVAADPAHLLPGVQSIVALGISYLTQGTTDATVPGTPHGRVARYAWGDDYHDVFQVRLRALHSFVQAQLGRPVGARLLSDTARITDRAVAQRAGLGWYGKNSNLLTHEFGSWVLLGELLLDVALPPDAPLRTHCGACTRCMPACPTGAIVAPGVVHSDRCISYLTIELRGPIPRDLRPLVGNWIFGCDICQEVCPVNARRDPPDHAEFRPRPVVGSSPALIPLLALTEAEFRERFRGSPIRRAKWAGLRRNVCVALGNSGDPTAIPALIAVLGADPALVRGHAAWALGRLAGPAARAALTARLAVEEDAWVREELVLALGEM
ncbi:MAG: tRNA epoxyqueuosine(34) reductase QueG [Chloroflexota bacterium]|nr:tRNA epoxyqueuosine(34) reductase QueG [Chloroflexota bacterium]